MKHRFRPFVFGRIAKSRVDKRSARHLTGDWRVYWISGPMPWRTPIGAGFQGVICAGRSFKGVRYSLPNQSLDFAKSIAICLSFKQSMLFPHLCIPSAEALHSRASIEPAAGRADRRAGGLNPFEFRASIERTQHATCAVKGSLNPFEFRASIERRTKGNERRREVS